MASPPASGTKIEIHINKTTDGTWVVVCTAGFLFSVWAGLIGFAHLTSDDLHGIRGEYLALIFLRLIGPFGFRLIAFFCAYICATYGHAAAWRLYSATPALTADASGLTFHPSLHSKPLKWDEVVRVGITKGRPAELEFKLSSRFWTVNNPLAGTSVQIPIMTTGMSYRQAEDAIKQMRHWKRA